jgi:hypothetical protein
VRGSSARVAVASLVGVLICAPAFADPTPPAPKKGQDPNEIICEKQEVVGSRLATRRVCRTRAEWADLRLQDRQEVEKVQVRRGMSGQ